MPITKNPSGWSNSPKSPSTHCVGRVLRIEQRTENRNWSDTLDFSDYRTTECTYALVWLGTHGVPPTGGHYSRITTAYFEDLAALPDYAAKQARDLEFHEQFAWVDCTNIFSDRCGYHVAAEVDADPSDGANPLMWANLLAWEAYHKGVAAKAAAAAAAEAEARAKVAAAENAKKAASLAKKAAKEAASKEEAEKLLAATPAKGTRVTVGGFTGTVFWKGVSKYYGKWNARFGVKDAKGTVQWIDAAHWAR